MFTPLLILVGTFIFLATLRIIFHKKTDSKIMASVGVRVTYPDNPEKDRNISMLMDEDFIEVGNTVVIDQESFQIDYVTMAGNRPYIKVSRIEK